MNEVKISKEEIDTLIEESVDKMLLLELMSGTMLGGGNTISPFNLHSLHTVKNEVGEQVRAPIINVEELKRLLPVIEEVLVQLGNVYIGEEKIHKRAEHTYGKSHHKNAYDSYVAQVEKMMRDATRFKDDFLGLIEKNIASRREYMQTASRVGRHKTKR